MYKKVIRPILFLLQPEAVHKLIVSVLRIFHFLGITQLFYRLFFKVEHSSLEKVCFGIKFPNPVGLGAGFDKDATMVDILSDFGFGFIEIGTVTPKPQPGNDKPRLFRLKDDSALINRMGFNNEGVDKALKQLMNRKSKIIVGGNIGKNKITLNSEATNDYITCLNTLYDHVDYFVVNVSSPNTPGLRELQEKDPLIKLLKSLKEEIAKKATSKPILLKISPDLSDNQLDDIIEIVIETGLDGIVATNTTISRDDLKTNTDRINKIGNGGLSGQPLKERSNEVIRYLRKGLPDTVPIIGVGGIMNAEDAVQKMKAGASLLQVYTGFIYEGPELIKNINKTLVNRNFN